MQQETANRLISLWPLLLGVVSFFFFFPAPSGWGHASSVCWVGRFFRQCPSTSRNPLFALTCAQVLFWRHFRGLLTSLLGLHYPERVHQSGPLIFVATIYHVGRWRCLPLVLPVQSHQFGLDAARECAFLGAHGAHDPPFDCP